MFDAKLLLSAAVFRNERNSIKVNSNDPTLPDQTLDGGQRVEGLSLGASGNITSRWTISDYMYLKSKMLQGVSDLCRANPGARPDPANPGQTISPCGNSVAFPDPVAAQGATERPEFHQ